MKRILLTIDKLNTFSHCETMFADIVDYFHQQGWTTDVVTRAVGKDYLSRFDILKEKGRFRLFQEDHHPLDKEYQLIWICQGYLSTSIISAMQNEEISGVCLFQHYHNYADQDLPYGAAVENRLAWRSLAVSAISYTKLALKGIDQRKLHIFPLSLNDLFLNHEVPIKNNTLDKVLLMTDKKTDEINSLNVLLNQRGVQLQLLNTERKEMDITPEFLSSFQVVMGQSRVVMQALSLGIPAYVTDSVYGAGYLNDINFESHLDRHFIADGDITTKDPENWRDDIINNYEEARGWAKNFQNECKQNYSLSQHLSDIIEQLPTPQVLTLSVGEAASFSLHQKIIADEAEKSRVLEGWLKKRQPSSTRIQVLKSFIQQAPHCGDIGVVLLTEGATEEDIDITQRSLSHQYWSAGQTYTAHTTGDVQNIIEETTHALLLTVKAGTLLFPQALLSFAEHCLRKPDAMMWYCDSIVGQDLLTADMLFKPDLNLDMLRTQPYIGTQMLLSVAAIRDLGGLDLRYTQLPLVDLAFKVIENYGFDKVAHISEPLMQVADKYGDWLVAPVVIQEHKTLTQAHIDRCGLSAVVENGLQPGLNRVRFKHDVQPLVSVIIPTRDRLPLLKRCIETLMSKTRWTNYELIIIDNASEEDNTISYLDKLESLSLSNVSVLRWSEVFNYSAINNFAAKHAKGDLLLFLNNDIEIIDPEWMHAMVEHALRPEIAMVGPILINDGKIQHAGYVTGIGAGVAPIYEGVIASSPGYMSRLQSTLNVTALSAACMMMRTSVFNELDGFCEAQFSIYLGDVDLAFKAREAGYLAVMTPHAVVGHMGAATRVLEEKTGVSVMPEEETYAALRSKWNSSLLNDISYNANFARLGENFSLGVRHASLPQPLPGRPLPVILAGHKNFTGCGQYRVMQPFKAMENHLMIDGGIFHGIPSAMEVAQLQPDVLIMELVFSPEINQQIKKIRQVSETKIIMEYDDYVLNLPIKSAFRKSVPKDIASRLRRTVEHADWLVVSTEPLAEAYAAFHPDIRVAKNRLDVELWEPLKSLRNQGRKPRVGWAGGSSHTGDLEILLPFMKELENEVEWVFMGMKPQNVKCEYHIGVPFEFYPQKLASLNLDLALVPLEMNQFNECKSNLRLLELGACGVPVICTDIDPYRCDLPVTRVTNRYKDWMNAIREHLSDLNALGARGDQLREAVHRDWMLREKGLTDWAYAWLPK